jgi:opacity protein-like surface antigen
MKIRLMAAAALLAIASSPAFADPVRCFTNKVVSEVQQGYVGLAQGSDWGNALYFKVEGSNNMYALYYTYNLNDAPGNAHHRTLLLSQIGGYKIEAWDHNGTNCTTVSSLVIRN